MPRSTSHHPSFNYQGYATFLLMAKSKFQLQELEELKKQMLIPQEADEERKKQATQAWGSLRAEPRFVWANEVVAKLVARARVDVIKPEEIGHPIVIQAGIAEEDFKRDPERAVKNAADDIVNAFYADRATNTKQEPIPDADDNVFKIGKVTVTQKGDYEYTYQIPANFTGVIADPKGKEPFATDFRIYYKGALVCIVPALDVIGLSVEEREQAFEKARKNALARQQQEQDYELARRLQEEAARQPLSPELQRYVDVLDKAFHNRGDLKPFSDDDLNKIVQIQDLTDDAKERIIEELRRSWKRDDGYPIGYDNNINPVVEDAKHELALRQTLTPGGLKQVRGVLRSVVDGNEVNVDPSEVPGLIELLNEIPPLDSRTKAYLAHSVGCDTEDKFNELLNNVRGKLEDIQRAIEAARREQQRAAREQAAQEEARKAAEAEKQKQLRHITDLLESVIGQQSFNHISNEDLATIAGVGELNKSNKHSIMANLNRDPNITIRNISWLDDIARLAASEQESRVAIEAARQELQPVVDAVNQWEDTSSEDKPSLSDETLVTLAQISGKTEGEKQAILDAVNEDRQTRGEDPLTKEDLNNISAEANTALKGKNQSSLRKAIDKNNITYAQLARGNVPEGMQQEAADMLAGLEEVRKIMGRPRESFAKVTAPDLEALEKMCGRVGIDNPNAALFTQIQAQLDSQQPSEGQQPAVGGDLASKFWEVFVRTHFLEQYKDAVRGNYGDKVQAKGRYLEATGVAKGQKATANRGAEVQEARDYMARLEDNLNNALGLKPEVSFVNTGHAPYLNILSGLHPVGGAEEKVYEITGEERLLARPKSFIWRVGATLTAPTTFQKEEERQEPEFVKAAKRLRERAGSVQDAGSVVPQSPSGSARPASAPGKG